ncbi:MAG: NADH-quinone oxidoreductase subunit M [Armatimonadetes bacterium]|nr:MAG: NADH-quinone oxidoreductase subunit M [Armatimonadota bacterium]
MDWLDNGLALSLVVFLPVVGAGIVLAIPKAQEAAVKWTALIVSLVTLALAVVLAVQFDYSAADTYQFGTAIDTPWIEAINAHFHIGVDGISLPMVVLTTLITMLCIVYSFNHWPEPRNPKLLLAMTLLLGTGMAGTFVALDLVLFFVFFEIVLLPMYFMIGIWGDRGIRYVPIFGWKMEMRLYASLKFFVFTLFGSAFMLLSFLALYFRSGDTLGYNTFSMVELSAIGPAGAFTGTFAFLVFLGLFLGFAVKVPMWPVHTWLPDAHTAAPTIGSVILAAILLKLGTYGFIRIALPILPDEAVNWAPFIGVLAVIGIIYGSLACLAQTDMKRLIAYSSVGHMGFVMLGIATLTDIGINAAIIGMVAHGLITGLLFFVVGSMSHRYHTRDMNRLGGAMVSLPKMGLLLGFAAMASLGLPSLAGFWGEFMSLMASFDPLEAIGATGLFRGFMVVGAVGTVLTAAYMLYLLRSVIFGEPADEWVGQEFQDVDAAEWLAWAPLVVGIIAIGIFPKIVFGATNDAVVSLVQKAFGA